MAADQRRNRQVSLVVVDRAGSPRGTMGPIEVDEPWWPEAGPIIDAVTGLDGFGPVPGEAPNGITVLRLLRAEPDPVEPMGGRVTYAVECDGPIAPGVLGPVDDADRRLLDEHPLRLPWAHPGGPAADLAWVGQQLEVAGPPRQHRTWNLSSIWSIPTAGGPVWLKTVPPFLAHEAAILDVLAGQPIPRLLAADQHRLLLADLPGEDGYAADDTEQMAMVNTLVGIQIAAVDRVDELLDRGVPDLRAEPLRAELTTLVERLAPDRPILRRLIDELGDRLTEAARWSPPDTIVHGDPHPGNCRRGVDPPIWFDWGDGFVGNPLLDLAATHRLSPPAVAAWFAAMRSAWPGCDPGRASAALEPVAALHKAWVYQRFLDGIEPSEHVYHRDDVGQAIDRAEALLA